MLRPVCLLLWLTGLAAAQNQAEFYPVHFDQDALAGAPDFSFLNQPVTPASRVFLRDGAFYRVGPDLEANTPDDERIRFFGVNLAFRANFPDVADAARIARRLRRIGVNLVRLHHMDTQPDSNPENAGSLLTTGPYPTLNAVAVTRLRRFIDALKAEGIYINLNLHVGYAFRPPVDSIPQLIPFPRQSKPVRLFHPRMLELQAAFTRKAIEALSLKNDPALAMVEISNETSLVYHWQNSSLDRVLEGEYRDVLHRGWNDFLRERYTATDALRQAWGGEQPDGPDLLPSRWSIENHNGGRIELENAEDAVRINAPAAPRPIIIKQVGFTVETQTGYRAEIEMRADLPAGVSRDVLFDVKQDVSPWRTMTSQTVQVTGEWRKYEMFVQPAFALDNTGRFAVSIEKVGAPLYLRNARFFTAGKRALAAGESIEAGNIALVTATGQGTEARTNDYLLFLVDRDRHYLRQSLDAVRETTDALVPVAGTQMGFGGLLNIDSHDVLDYQDHHYYVDHYNFPNVSWDGRDWRFRDTSNIGSGAAVFANVAAAREGGRAYTVSEYNQPWPNTYAAETDPTLAVFARFQAWDSIMHFAYSHGRGWDDGVPNGFNINGDWTKFANLGQSAWLFRSGAIATGVEPVDIPVPRDVRLRATRERRNGSLAAFFTSALGYDPNVAFVHPVRIAKDSDAVPALPRAENPLRADTGEFTYDRDGKLFLIHSPLAAGVYGFAGRQRIESGAIAVEPAESARGYVALLANSLDGQPLTSSARILVSNPGYTLRSQPAANPPRPQRIILYPNTTEWYTLEPDQAGKPSGDLNGGRGPVWMERVELTLTLQHAAQNIAVYPLGSRGERLEPVAGVEKIDGGFRIPLQAAGQAFAPWYEIVSAE